jgi:hypothetical protein
MRFQTIIPFFIAFVFISCAPLSILAPTDVQISPPPSTFTPLPPSPTSQQPSTNDSPAPTSAANIERWVEYENALAAVFLPISDPPGKGLCEWEILGQSELEVYVWAMCQVTDSADGAAMSAPAVIYLSENGNIEKVEVPGDGSKYMEDIRMMFPQELQEKILSQSINNIDEMWPHIQLRHKNPAPPLIAGSGTSLP